ncbi:MAG: DUF2206 domain-containing protein [Chloroflexota bacterium]
MTGLRKNPIPGKFLFGIIALLAIVNLAVLLDIPVLRQVTGLFYLTFVPGFLFLIILKLNKLVLVEKVVFSAGLSFTFIMFFGLLLNYALPALGNNEPLSTSSLLISFSLATIILVVLAYLRNRDYNLSFVNLRLTKLEKSFLIVPLLFPLLSIIGTRIMNLTDNNLVLMFMIFLIAAFVISLCSFREKVSAKVLPIAIFLISISLLIMYSLRSNHIIGGDTHREFFIFRTVVDEHRWSQLGFGTLDTCLSISLLPAIYQSFLNIDPEYLFKTLPSLIVSLLPLAVYVLSKKYIGSFYAFLASILTTSQIAFLWTLSFARINIAIFFFSLAMVSLFHRGISGLYKKALLILFLASTVVSHYGVTYVFFFVLLLAWVVMKVSAFIFPPKNKLSGAKDDRLSSPRTSRAWLNQNVTFSLLLLFLAMLFFCYSETSGPTFIQGVTFVYRTFTRGEWFLGEETDQAVLAAFGKAATLSQVPQQIEFVFSWLVVILLSFGFLLILFRFRRAYSGFPAYSQNYGFEVEYLSLSIACYLILVATVILPYVSFYYGMARTYFQMIVLLSVFFVIGGIELAGYLILQSHWIILFVLIPYFLSTTGWMTQIFGFPRAVTLNSKGELYDTSYVLDGESYAAKWVKEYSEPGLKIYARGRGRDWLLSQGFLPSYDIKGSRISLIRNDETINGYAYLVRFDMIENKTVAEYPKMFSNKSKIYAGGNSEVYR